MTNPFPIGCIVSGGPSLAKLRNVIRSNQPEILTFRLKFFTTTADGKIINMATGSGVSLHAEVKSLHESRSGCHLRAAITKFRSEDIMHCGGIKNVYSDKIPVEWFQPGYEISFIHRGAAAEGTVFSIVDPDSKDKFTFITTSQPVQQALQTKF